MHVSIHAPLRGATPLADGAEGDAESFNPRAPAGRDIATNMDTAMLTGFNPRAPAGRDALALDSALQTHCFNPRAPAGRDPGLRSRFRLNQSFNPRAPAGRDFAISFVVFRGILFQSTRPCGARHLWYLPQNSTLRVSIHAPLRGATIMEKISGETGLGFNPRAPAGRDLPGL